MESLRSAAVAGSTDKTAMGAADTTDEHLFVHEIKQNVDFWLQT